jgi:hypothetical protein
VPIIAAHGAGTFPENDGPRETTFEYHHLGGPPETAARRSTRAP